MGLNIDDTHIDKKADPWSISYAYQNLTLDGYRTGTESRTNKNYPVLPTKITQEVHTVNVGV